MIKKLLTSILFISIFSYGQDSYNTLSVGFSSGFVSEMGSIQGYSFPTFNLDVAQQLTPSISVSTDFMFGFAEGSGWHGNEENFGYDVTFQNISLQLSMNILNLGDIPRTNRRIALNLKPSLFVEYVTFFEGCVFISIVCVCSISISRNI